MNKILIAKRDWLLRIGLSSFFLANSITAWTAADEFKDIVANHAWVTNIISASSMVKIIGINDALVFLLLISGKWRKYVAIWGILWIAGVIYMTNFALTDTIEHLGLIGLLAYYALSDK